MGLTPVVGGLKGVTFPKGDVVSLYPNYPKNVIEIFDTGSSARPVSPFTGDIRTNHIWLLRHTYWTTNWTKDALSSHFEKMEYSYHCRSNLLSIYDPEDVQPMRRKADLVKHLK